MNQLLVGIDEFDCGWKVVISGLTDDFDIDDIFVNKTDLCVIEFDEKKKRYLISHERDNWSKEVALQKMVIIAKLIYGFVAPQAPCSMRLVRDVQ